MESKIRPLIHAIRLYEIFGTQSDFYREPPKVNTIDQTFDTIFNIT
jgi:hypothetical protein